MPGYVNSHLSYFAFKGKISIVMKTRHCLFLLIFLMFSLSACSSRLAETPVPTLDATRLHETAVSQLTAENARTPSAMAPSATLAPAGAWTPVPTLDRTRPSIQTPTSELACLMASAGSPMDITIPDGSVMAPGESFSKVWRLENAGSCTWTRLFTVRFFSGNSLSAFQLHYLPQEVKPGDMIDITVDMEAPLKPGVYQSNWMLSDPNETLFGIGPNGDAPFWARVEVVSSLTATPTLTPTVSNTPTVIRSGEVHLGDGDHFDLETGDINPAGQSIADFNYQYTDNQTHVLSTENDSLWMVFGEQRPSFLDCLNAQETGNAISFSQVPQGSYICYRTSENNIGRFLINGLENQKLVITFVTWLVP